MRLFFLILLYPTQTFSQCVSARVTKRRTQNEPFSSNILECINYGFTNWKIESVYWDFKTRGCTLYRSYRSKPTQVIEFTYRLCETATEPHCMTVSEGAAGEGVELTGALTLSECRELCRVVTTCITASWTNNTCTIHKRSKNKKGNGTKVIFKDSSCKGRRPTVMRVNRNVGRGKRIAGVQDVSACMLTRSKLGYSLVDFDFRDGSCWYRQDPIAEKDLHAHKSAVEFAPQKDAQYKGEVTYNNGKTGSLRCGFEISSPLSEESCRTLCSGVSNCIAYSYHSERQACVIHFFACSMDATSGFTLYLVQFDGTLHKDPTKFSCFATTKRSTTSDKALAITSNTVRLHVTSKLACAVACSGKEACRGFTYTSNNQNRLCTNSFNAGEAYETRAC